MTQRKRKKSVFLWAPYDPRRNEAWPLWADSSERRVRTKLNLSHASWEDGHGLEARHFKMLPKKRRGE